MEINKLNEKYLKDPIKFAEEYLGLKFSLYQKFLLKWAMLTKKKIIFERNTDNDKDNQILRYLRKRTA